MPKKFNNKYNDGCIKIFKFLELLYKNEANYDDVMKIFSDEDSDEYKKEHVILNKYLNTLKVFGIKVDKVRNKYTMHNAPFSLKFDIDDLKTIKHLLSYNEALPAGKTKENLEQLLKTVISRFNADTQKAFEALRTTDTKDFSFYYSSIRDQIQQCEAICQDRYKVNVHYKSKNKEYTITGNPKDVIFDNKTAYLRVHKLPARENIDILITNILSIERLPTTKDTFLSQAPVVFKISGRLAQTYKLKEGEQVIDTKPDGTKIITNKSEPHETLIKRLMRYDTNCTVITPKSVRNEIIERINNTLKKYE